MEDSKFRRKAYDRLLEWKRQGNGASAMLIEDIRRVGKSTIAVEFAANEYNSYVLVDFTRIATEFKQTFLDVRNDLNGFSLYLSATFGVTLSPRRSLIIFDEVHNSPTGWVRSMCCIRVSLPRTGADDSCRSICRSACDPPAAEFAYPAAA